MSLANIKRVAFHDSLWSYMQRKLANILSLSPNRLLDPHVGNPSSCQQLNNEDNFLHLYPLLVGSCSSASDPHHHRIQCNPRWPNSRQCFELDSVNLLSLKNWIWHMEVCPKTLSLEDPAITNVDNIPPQVAVSLSCTVIKADIPQTSSSSINSSKRNISDVQNSNSEAILAHNCTHNQSFTSLPIQPKKFRGLLAGNADIGGKCYYHTTERQNQKWPNIGTSSGSDSHMENQASSSTAGGQWNDCNMESDVLTLKEKAGILGKYVQHVRQWEYTNLGVHHLKQPIPGFEFTLMSYNILSQDLLRANDCLYYHCNPAVLHWNYRSQNLLRELQESKADVICLQEMNEEHYNIHFSPAMKQIGYAGLYKKRTGTKQDGCAIFYKDSVFNLISYYDIEFFKPGCGNLDRDNIALIAMLQPKNALHNDVKLCIATTHLLFNPRRGDIKLAQLQLLLAEIDKFAFKGISKRTGLPHYHPVILCGDMNSEPFSPLYEFVCQGYLNYSGLRAGDISGQKEGARRGRICQEPLLHPGIGITNSSQYASLGHKKNIVHNGNGRRNSDMMQHNASAAEKEEASSSIANSSNLLGAPAMEDDGDISDGDEYTGGISHHLNFLSAYSHFSHEGAPFVTTQHTRASCTVDYIFYSARRKEIPSADNRPLISEGRLRLLGTYRTMTDAEVKNVGGLPNAFQSSDHLCLLAKFLLKIS